VIARSLAAGAVAALLAPLVFVAAAVGILPGRAGAVDQTTMPTPASVPLAPTANAGELADQVLANPRLTIYAAGRGDIASGVIDSRVLTLLQTLSQRWELTVTSLKSGHSRCVGGGARAGCSVSNHWHGRGVDIAEVHGAAVTAGNTAALDIARTLAALPAPLRPDEVGTPWPALDDPGFFADAAHRDHLHIGYDRKAPEFHLMKDSEG